MPVVCADAFLGGAPWQAAATAGVVAGAFASGTPGTHTSFIDATQLEAIMAGHPLP